MQRWGGRDYGDSVLKLAVDGSSLVIRDYFTPYEQARLCNTDADLGSSGPTLLPDQPGPHRHLLLQPTKGAEIYVIDRDEMGQFPSEGDAVVQRIGMRGGGYGAMAHWNGHVFFACSDDYLRDYAIEKRTSRFEQIVTNEIRESRRYAFSFGEQHRECGCVGGRNKNMEWRRAAGGAVCVRCNQH
jgi:hypothetical protein